MEAHENKNPDFPHPDSFNPGGGTVEGMFNIDEDYCDEEVVYQKDYDKLMKAYRKLYEKINSFICYYLIVVWKDVEPELIGPYTSVSERDAEALQQRYQEGNEHGLYRLDVNGDKITVDVYSGLELDLEVKDSDGNLCKFVSHFECPGCGYEWMDRWSCACDDECPRCKLICSPVDFFEADIGPINE